MSNIKDVVVPEGWEYLKLSELGFFKTSSVDKKIKKDETEISLLNYMDVYRNNFIDNTIKFMKVTSDKQKMINSSVKKGDMFFTPSSETPEDIGYSAVSLSNITNLLYSYHLVRLRFNKEVSLEFKGFLCNSEFVLNQFSRLCTGSTRYTLGLNDFNNTKVLLPQSLQEQQKIAEILSTVDEAIEKTDALIEKYKKIKTGLMEDLFTKGIDVNTGKPHTKFKESELGKIPESWEIERLENITTKIADRDHTTPVYFESGIPIISPKDFDKHQKIRFTKCKFISKEAHLINRKKTDITTNDIVFTRIGAGLGKSCIVTSNMPEFSILHSAALIRANKKTNPKFLLYTLKSSYLQKQITDGVQSIGVPDLGMDKMKVFKIKYTKNIREQEHIIKVLSEADNKIEKEEAYKEKLEKIKKGLMNDLLTGKVRVKY